jgi:hypothetical protein
MSTPIAPHAIALLRAHSERPRRRAAESADEFSSRNGGGHLPAPVSQGKGKRYHDWDGCIDRITQLDTRPDHTTGP